MLGPEGFTAGPYASDRQRAIVLMPIISALIPGLGSGCSALSARYGTALLSTVQENRQKR
jgi:hypothetical protein